MGVEEKLRGFLSKSAKVSKSVFTKAGDAVQEFSDKSVIKIDRMKLENQKSKKIADLGQAVYDLFRSSDSADAISADNEKLKGIYEEILNVEKQIEQKDEELKNFAESDESDKS